MIKQDILVSVILPVYNQAHTLEAALQSVRNQSVENWECVIVDDGSTDSSAEIAKRFSESDTRFIYVYQKNRGVSAARNQALSLAKGRFIQFLDGDDVLEKEKWQLQLDWLTKQNQPSVSYSDYYRFDKDPVTDRKWFRMSPLFSEQEPLRDLILKWETETSVPGNCFLFDARFFKDYRISFDESLPNHVDWDCWIQVFSFKPPIQYINEKLAGYRLHTGGITGNLARMRKGFLKAIKKQIAASEPESPKRRWLEMKYQETQYRFAPWSLLYWRRYYWYVKNRILLIIETAGRSLP